MDFSERFKGETSLMTKEGLTLNEQEKPVTKGALERV